MGKLKDSGITDRLLHNYHLLRFYQISGSELIEIHTSSFGWAVGCDSSGKGIILKSTNGGSSWEINVGNLPAHLNTLYIKDNYAWAAGENGLIFRTTNAGPTWAEDEKKLPAEFILNQNYPNPFNPATTIEFSIPSKEFVTLKVYDLLGKEVAQLVNAERSAGSYRVDFNGSNLSSGIYFYTLKAGKYIETKKIILMK